MAKAIHDSKANTDEHKKLMALLSDQLAKRNWSHADLSRETGIASSTISRWFGWGRMPDYVSCQRLASVLGLDVDFLLEEAGWKVRNQTDTSTKARQLIGM